MWPLTSVLIVCAVFVLFLAAFTFSGLYEHFLFYPLNDMLEPTPIEGTEWRSLSFREPGGNEIVCWYYKKEANDAGLILVSHGNAGNISHRGRLAEHLIKNSNYSVLLYDYRGYGRSSGTPQVRGILEDGLAAFDFAVQELHYKPCRIIVYGESLGCSVACAIAAQRQPQGIIWQSGFRSLPAIARDAFFPFKIMPGFVFPEPKLASEKLLAGKHSPLLIMHGRHDEVIPFRHSEILYARASEPKKFVVLEHSGHNDTYIADADLFDRSIADFVQSLKGQ
jgi:uncharacterized protein